MKAVLKKIRSKLEKYSFYYWMIAFLFSFYNNILTYLPIHRARVAYLRIFFRVKVSKTAYIGSGQTITGYHNGVSLRVGNNTIINRNCYIDGRAGITIGNNVNISFGTTLITLQHDYNSATFACEGKSIIIHDYVWIGANATILPGVTLGEGAVVAAGAVVSRNVDPYTVVGGVPARFITKRNNDLVYTNTFKPLLDTDIADDSKFYRNSKGSEKKNSGKKKKIALVTLAPFLPIDSGGKLATANTILPLTEEYDYHLFSFKIPGDNSYEENKDVYDKLFKSVTLVPKPKMLFELKKWEKVKFIINHILNRLPLMDISFYSKDLLRALKKLNREQGIDIIETHNLHCAYTKKAFSKIPMVLINQNIEGDLFPFWEPATNSKYKKFMWRRIANISRKNTFDIEIGNLYNIESKIFMSKDDMARVNDIKNYSEFIPIAFETSSFKEKQYDGKLHVLWLGGFGWYPNEEGMRWFISEVYPYLKDNENIVFHIIGGSPFEELLKLNSPGRFEVMGRVDDLEPFFDQSHILISPILSGSGVRIKILESMSKGLAVVATTRGAQGIEVVHENNILIEDDPKRYADSIVRLSNDHELIEKLRRNSMQYIDENHSISRALFMKRRIYDRISLK
ncbi:glycosyltransferase [Paenibacillus sp. FSL L8-0435]|uniref:glycosyltransferase n=1 Tax=Paenibacillus sp. FSL L8-0435 TaxID=2954618 RepID=UPI0030D7CD77